MANDRPTTPSDARGPGVIPADLAAMVAIVFLVNVTVFAPLIRETPLRVPFVLAFVLLVPGYAVVAALYPERGEPIKGGAGGAGSVLPARFRSGVGGIERVALSVALSAVIVPTIGYPLVLRYGGVRIVPITLSLTVFTLVATGAAIVRRRRLPPDERFVVPYRDWIAAVESRVGAPDGGVDAALTVLLAASVLLALGSLGFAAANLPETDEFSSIAILAEADSGELVADGYPTEFGSGESEELVIAVDNHEYRSAEYTVVVVEQSLAESGNETVVEEQRELDRFQFGLEHGETERIPYALDPTFSGEVQIAWLLYVGDAPEDPSLDDAPYRVHVVVEAE